jgi:hypothetical protein
MHAILKTGSPIAAALLIAVSSGAARAAATTAYAQPGSYNSVKYSFTAQHTGDIVAYFTGASAAFDSEISLLVNGVATGFSGLGNHISAVGQKLNLGHVHAGDTLVFVLKVLSKGAAQIFSDASMNAGYDKAATGANHIYSSAYDGSNPALAGVPAGTAIGFEDQTYGHSDYDYNDETFVFTNVAAAVAPAPPPMTPAAPGGPAANPTSPIPTSPDPTPPPVPTPTPIPTPPPPVVSAVPEPSSWGLMLMGVGVLGAVLRHGRRGAAAAQPA